MTWEKIVIHVESCPVTLYVNSDDSRVIVFPAFGRYFSMRSDGSTLTFAISFLFHQSKSIITHEQYLSCLEDTNPLYQEVA